MPVSTTVQRRVFCRLALTVWAGQALGAAAATPSAASNSSVLPKGAQAGDLLFRQGTERVSQLVLSVDSGAFSHVGMLVGQPGAWQVLHATPSERSGQPDGVVLDPLDFYLAPERSRIHRLYQVQSVNNHARARAVQWAMQQQGRGFQMMDEGNGTYCTLLVWQAWQQAGLDLEVPFKEITIPILQGRYLMPSALSQSRKLVAL